MKNFAFLNSVIFILVLSLSKLNAQVDPIYELMGVTNLETSVTGCIDTLLLTDNCSSLLKRKIIASNFDFKINLIYSYAYTIDLDANGSLDKFGNTNNLEIDLPTGHHIIQWTIKSSVGQTIKCSSNIFVKNQSPPVISLKQTENLFAIDLLTKKFIISSKEFKNNLTVQNNCCKPIDFEFRLIKSADSDHKTPPSLDVIQLTCSDLGNSDIEIWVGDCGLDVNLNNTIEDNERNWAYAGTKILTKDTNFVCGFCDLPMVKGLVIDQFDQPVKGVEVTAGLINIMDISRIDGGFSFLLPCFNQYKLTANFEDEDYLSHLDKNDLNALAEHILGQSIISDPYFFIAADVNQDKAINIYDMVLLNKLLQKPLPLPSPSQYWKFIDASYNFKSSNPLIESYNEFINIFVPDSTQVNFIGIRLGDLVK